jgi:uroporphyrin-III C-methyltransferase / precorrin-2 dehydrogenase / sirohydrochlorin ferrochelatase
MSEPADARVYPVFLRLAGRRALVVGAGPVAERKIAALVEAQAVVRVVAPEATEGVRALAAAGSIEWIARPFEERDVDGAWIVVAATSDGAAQERVSAAASTRRVFVIAVDDPAHASAYSGAVVTRPPFTIAISSSGATPALTRLVREIIEHVLPGDDWIDHAKRLRAKWLASGTPMGERFGELVRELANHAKRGPS